MSKAIWYFQILFLAFVFCFGSIKANDLTSAYMIIIGGGKTYEDALKAKAKYEENTELRNQIISKIDLILSDTVKGLNPGFYIAATGYCEREDLSEIVIKVIGKSMKGIYKRKVMLNEKVLSDNLISVKVQSAPFEGNFNKYKDEEIIVKFEPSYIKRIGSFDVNYYLTWNKESGYIRYLSELDFTRVRVFENDTINCIQTEYNQYYPEIFSKTCYYPNGIESVYSRDGYGSKESMLFPLNKFSFNEIMFYYLSNGYFKELLENDFFNDSTGMFENSPEDPLKIEYKLYDSGIWKSGGGFPRPVEELKMEGDYIIYEYRTISIE
jgi:hypothetical protein